MIIQIHVKNGKLLITVPRNETEIIVQKFVNSIKEKGIEVKNVLSNLHCG